MQSSLITIFAGNDKLLIQVTLDTTHLFITHILRLLLSVQTVYMYKITLNTILLYFSNRDVHLRYFH